jgi:hypothetical protein
MRIVDFKGVIRVRLVSSLFTADLDVYEEPSLIKLEIIKKEYNNHFDKQFALKLKVNIFIKTKNIISFLSE